MREFNGMNKLLLLLSNCNFRNFFIFNVITNISVSICVIGINWFIVDYTKQNQTLGIYMATSLFSNLVASFFIGTLIDRHSRRNIMILSNLSQAFFLVILLILIWINASMLGLIYVLAVVTSIGLAVYSTSSRSFMQELLEKESLIYGNSIFEMSLQLGSIIAAGITGFLYKYFGFKIVLLSIIISLVLACVFLFKIKFTSIINKKDNDLKYILQLTDGMKYLFANKMLFLFGIISFVPYIVTIASNSVLPGYVREHLSLSSIEYGISDMLYAIGSFLSGIIISVIIKNQKKTFVMKMFVVSIISLAFLVFNKNIWGLYIAYFCFGLGNSSLKVILNTIIMEIVPTQQYGRVLSFLNSTSCIIQMLIILGMGYLIDVVPVIYGYLLLSVIMAFGFWGINYTLPKVEISSNSTGYSEQKLGVQR